MHNLQLESLHLVGGNREVHFNTDFSVVTGPIASGKTTLVKLIKGMLGRVPKGLPPETQAIQSLRGRIRLDSEIWIVDRPLVFTTTAIVSLSRREATGSEGSTSSNGTTDRVLDTIRLPASEATRTEPQTYQSWVLNRLGIPEVSVPRARTRVTSRPTPVTINDWLGYCIIKDEDLDTSVFGHKDPFIDRKRRAVFELIYGIYDRNIAALQAELRSTELRMDKLDLTIAAVRHFLQDTSLSGLEEIERRLYEARSSLDDLDRNASQLAVEAHEESASLRLRRQIAEAEVEVNEQEATLSAARKNRRDLHDLHGTLQAQSKRLTRAIVADEWLVDFDFIVCPRCGTGVEASRSVHSLCYLCNQEPQQSGFHSEMIKEQQVVASQSIETQELIENRSDQITAGQHNLGEVRRKLVALNEELNRRTADFVSVYSERMTSHASERARLRAEVQRLSEYRDLFIRYSDHDGLRSRLEGERVELTDALGRSASRSERSRRLVKRLESRFLNYLQRLNISLSDLPLTAAINPTTYLPEISNRPFDALSSQGLTVLVNVAHALAHHTVAIDHGLPLPGVLVLDGLSSNVGHEGFDRERLDDVFRLLMEETAEYRNRLQVIALANDVPSFALGAVVLELTPESGLVQT